MKILLAQNTDHDKDVVPYHLHVEFISLSRGLNSSFTIPLHWQHIKDKSIYSLDLCGLRIEAHTPPEVLPMVEKLLPCLVKSARLPTYVFIARHSRRIYPVYTVGDEVLATVPGGPLFRHVELAKVREYLTDYLHQTGELWLPGHRDRLHVRGVHKSTLGLVRPLFYLKKRPKKSGDNEFWAPVFPAEDEAAIYTYAASAKRQAMLEHGREVFQLRSLVAQALMADKRLNEDYDLRLDRLRPDYWAQLKTDLKAYPNRLVWARNEMELYQNWNIIVAVEYRHDEDRYSLFLGQDECDLRDRAARDFIRRGLIDDISALRYEPKAIQIKI